MNIIKTIKFREAGVLDTEEPQNGQTEFTMDHLMMDSQVGEHKAPAPLVVANHEGGGRFSDATAGKGTQGDRHWLGKRIPTDADNCGTKDAKAQVKLDQERPIVALPSET